MLTWFTYPPSSRTSPLASLVLPNGKATRDVRGKPDGRVDTYLNLRFREGLAAQLRNLIWTF